MGGGILARTGAPARPYARKWSDHLQNIFDIHPSLIISTYNQPAWLEKVFWGLARQSTTDFEMVIADDGSGPETRELIDRYRSTLPCTLHHVWHEDRGFRKTEILNEAIRRSTGDYLIFTDGDCIPRADFVATHLRLRRPNTFLSGGYYKLNRGVSEQIDRDDVVAQRCFDPAWLHARGQARRPLKDLKLTRRPGLARLLNRLTPTRPSWNGHNASTWRALIEAAGGFDTRMQYGGEDRELGERLRNAGVRARQIRYTAICVHLDHTRGYVTPEMLARNQAIRHTTRHERRTTTDYGLTSNRIPS